MLGCWAIAWLEVVTVDEDTTEEENTDAHEISEWTSDILCKERLVWFFSDHIGLCGIIIRCGMMIPCKIVWAAQIANSDLQPYNI